MSDELNKVIRWFLSKQEMSPKKLQKMLYYAQAWTVTLLNDSNEEIKNYLFDDKFEAWVHGPVIPSVYQEYKSYGYEKIPMVNEEFKFTQEIEDVLNQVLDVYGHYNGNELENITHQEKPWASARKDYHPLEICNNVITKKSMYDYYINQIA